MMAIKNIPTETITVGKGKEKSNIDIYQWILQTEEDKYNELLTGNNDIDIDGVKEGGSLNLKTNFEALNKANMHLVSAYLASMTIEEYDCLHPEIRKEVLATITEKRNKKK